MQPGRNLVEGIVHAIYRKRRTDGPYTVEYYAVTLQTPDGYINFRMEGENPDIINRFRPQAVVRIDMLMEADLSTVLKVRSVEEISGFKASDIRTAISDPPATAEAPTTVNRTNQRVSSLMDQVKDPTARAILNRAIETDAFKTAKAADYHIHKYEGGLQRHSVGVAEESLKILESVARKDIPIKLTAAEQETFDVKEGLLKRGTEISKSVVIAGALLHDLPAFNTQEGIADPLKLSSPKTSIIDQLAASIRSPDLDVLSSLKNIVEQDIRRSPEAFIVSMGNHADDEASRTQEYIHQTYLNDIDGIIDQPTSPEIAHTRAERARALVDSQTTLNTPDGGFRPPTRKRK